MKRQVVGALAMLLAVGGCMRPEAPMGPLEKPAPAPEMKKLERMVGNWAWSGEMVSPSKEEMMEHMPAGSKEPQTTFGGTGKMEWALGGTALRGEGSFEIGEGQKMTYVEYWMWDGKAGKYRTLFLNDWGEIGEGWATPCRDCDGFCSKARSVDAQGNKKRVSGCMRWVDNDTHEWSFTESGPMGEFSMKGTSKRQK